MDISVLAYQLRMTLLAAETSPSINLQSLFLTDAENIEDILAFMLKTKEMLTQRVE